MRAFFEIGDMITRVMGHHRRGKIIVIPIIKPTMGFSWNGTNCRSLPRYYATDRQTYGIFLNILDNIVNRAFFWTQASKCL